MTRTLKLLCILAHPDDETFAVGGVLAKYAAEGIETYLITATRGEYGWTGAKEAYPGEAELGKRRECELHAAGEILGIHEITLLDYIDGQLDSANPREVIRKLRTHIQRIQPDVIITFDPFGSYGHPDHIAISQLTLAAVVNATTAIYHTAKLYFFVDPPHLNALYTQAFGDLVMQVDGVERRLVTWADWSITTRVDTSHYWRIVWQAIAQHQTQINADTLAAVPDGLRRSIFETAYLYRVFSTVNGGRTPETDIFEGLRRRKSAPVNTRK